MIGENLEGQKVVEYGSLEMQSGSVSQSNKNVSFVPLYRSKHDSQIAHCSSKFELSSLSLSLYRLSGYRGARARALAHQNGSLVIY